MTGGLVVVLQSNLDLKAAVGHIVVGCGDSAVSSCQEGQSRVQDPL